MIGPGFQVLSGAPFAPETTLSNERLVKQMSNASRSRAPSLPALVFLIWSLAVALGAGTRLLNADGDTARHLRHGETILSTGHLIHADSFSFTKPGAPFVGFEYGSQVLLAGAHRLGGLAGVVIWSALLIALTYALLTRFLLRRGVEPGFAYLVVTVGAVLSSMHWAARPHLVTQLLVVILLDLLDRKEGPLWWQVGLLFVVWANLHGGFLFGLILIGLFAAGHLAAALLGAADRTASLARARALGIALLIGAAASFVNPYGASLPLHVVGFFGQDFIQQATSEFQAPGFRDLGTRLFLLALLGGVAGLAWVRERIALQHLVVMLALTAFALMARRNIALWALTALPLLAVHFDAAARHLPEPPRFRKSFAETKHGSTWPWVAAATAPLLALALLQGRVGTLQLVPSAFRPATFPVEAMAKARAAKLDGRIFTQFTWGGYQLYAWPEQKVFIDGGTDFYGEDLLKDYLNIWTLQPGWRERLAEWDISVAILPGRSPLANQLVREPGWGEWYRDSTALILVRGGE